MAVPIGGTLRLSFEYVPQPQAHTTSWTNAVKRLENQGFLSNIASDDKSSEAT